MGFTEPLRKAISVMKYLLVLIMLVIGNSLCYADEFTSSPFGLAAEKDYVMSFTVPKVEKPMFLAGRLSSHHGIIAYRNGRDYVHRNNRQSG